MKVGRSRYVLTLTLAFLFSAGFPAGYVCANLYNDAVDKQIALADKEKYGDMYELMLQMNGKVVTLEKFKEPITVTLAKSFSEKEKEQIVDAINTLDEISPNLNYTIIDSPNISIMADINIDKYDDLVSPMALATTSLKYNQKAQITYPIFIDINEPFSTCFENIDIKENDTLSYVVKHELMHTLGFCDLYDEKHFDKSIMWYSTENANVVSDYTERDKACINKIYDDILVSVQHPKEIYYAINSSKTIYKEQDENINLIQEELEY